MSYDKFDRHEVCLFQYDDRSPRLSLISQVLSLLTLNSPELEYKHLKSPYESFSNEADSTLIFFSLCIVQWPHLASMALMAVVNSDPLVDWMRSNGFLILVISYFI